MKKILYSLICCTITPSTLLCGQLFKAPDYYNPKFDKHKDYTSDSNYSTTIPASIAIKQNLQTATQSAHEATTQSSIKKPAIAKFNFETTKKSIARLGDTGKNISNSLQGKDIWQKTSMIEIDGTKTIDRQKYGIETTKVQKPDGSYQVYNTFGKIIKYVSADKKTVTRYTYRSDQDVPKTIVETKLGSLFGTSSTKTTSLNEEGQPINIIVQNGQNKIISKESYNYTNNTKEITTHPQGVFKVVTYYTLPNTYEGQHIFFDNKCEDEHTILLTSYNELDENDNIIRAQRYMGTRAVAIDELKLNEKKEIISGNITIIEQSKNIPAQACTATIKDGKIESATIITGNTELPYDISSLEQNSTDFQNGTMLYYFLHDINLKTFTKSPK